MKDNARISEAERARRAEAAKNLAELFYTLEKMEEADKKHMVLCIVGTAVLAGTFDSGEGASVGVGGEEGWRLHQPHSDHGGKAAISSG